ncbi:hypothetical protein BKA66DRAFT_444026 [Pyrenochaeta sp. MPI-SDFR-AT-0127]|nr:hypothetical protein BKA66DRAFT_444026 [Pyrenochaeta sp. MPI-SDFR-AT-0127]
MVVSVVYELFQRLAILVRLWRPRPGLGAFALPPEITLMIATHLSNPSVISLALTCRHLHSLCFPRPPRLNTPEKEALLLLLEKDLATLYYCHYCVRLHRWYSRWGNYIHPFVYEDLPCKQQLHLSVVSLPLICYIPYHHARLAMNRHFYGANHGPSVQYFAERASMHNSLFSLSGTISDSRSLRARIIEDQLLFLSVTTMCHSRGDSRTLRNYVDSKGHLVCRHLTQSNRYSDCLPMQLPELAKDKITPEHFAACHQSLRSCPICLTDYCIDISWRGRRKGYVIKVSIYRLLGDCRSPFSWSWSNMATWQGVDEPRIKFPIQYRPGIVRDTWTKADGLDEGAQCDWVEIPEQTSSR